MTKNIYVLVAIRELFLANFFHLCKAHLILKRLLFMDLFKYFKRVGKRLFTSDARAESQGGEICCNK